MNRLGKSLVLSSAILFFGLIHSTQIHAAAPEHGVKIQINDELVRFSDGKPFVDEQSKIQVPLRAVAEKLGFEIQWRMEGREIALTIEHADRTISVKTGESKAEIDGTVVEMDSVPVFKDGIVYVPLRFLAESFGMILQWDADNGIAIIGADGNYHAPAWYAPRQPDIAETAKSFTGVPYVYGGTSPRGFDCSGFVQFVFERNGVKLPRTSEAMYRTAGKKVFAPEEGDLVFFAANHRISHVGIYIGNHQFISATNKRGVHIDSLDEPYWRTRYIGAKRVL